MYSCVSLLLNNLKMTKSQNDPKFKEELEKESNKTDYSFEDSQYTMRPIRKNSTVFFNFLLLKLEFF